MRIDANTLRTLMTKQQISLPELADKSGIPEYTLTQIMTGGKEYLLDPLVWRVAVALHVSADRLAKK